MTRALVGHDLRIGIVWARFNAAIVEALRAACTRRLTELGVSPAAILDVSVPGALEIPLVLQKLAISGKFDALIALGAVIRGETYHFEVVSNESTSGVTQVQLDTGIPIANGILTTNSNAQAEARAQVKGAECAEVAIEMVNLIRAIALSLR